MMHSTDLGPWHQLYRRGGELREALFAADSDTAEFQEAGHELSSYVDGELSELTGLTTEERRALLEQNSLPAAEFCHLLGISEDELYQLEAGRRVLTILPDADDRELRRYPTWQCVDGVVSSGVERLIKEVMIGGSRLGADDVGLLMLLPSSDDDMRLLSQRFIDGDYDGVIAALKAA